MYLFLLRFFPFIFLVRGGFFYGEIFSWCMRNFGRQVDGFSGDNRMAISEGRAFIFSYARGYAPKPARKIFDGKEERVEIFCVLFAKNTTRSLPLKKSFGVFDFWENRMAANRIFGWPSFCFFAFDLLKTLCAPARFQVSR